MKSIILIVLLSSLNHNSSAQSYFDEIAANYLAFFNAQDSIILPTGEAIKVLHDSLITIDYKKRITRKYWETDTTGKVFNIYYEITEKNLFVVMGLDAANREYRVYQKKGKKKVKLITWLEHGIEKQKRILFRSNPERIAYFKV